jgi:acetoin utilization protein AcuB
MLVGEIMTPNPITVTPDTSHRKAFELMQEHHISQLPVVDNGKLVGIVSKADLLSTQPSPATSLSIHEIYSLLEKLRVGQFMTHPVYTVEEDCPLEEAAKLMIDYHLGSMPIVRGEQLVGIVSETDMFETLIDVLGGGETGIRFTVAVENVPGKLAEIANAVYQAGGNILSTVRHQRRGEQSCGLTIKETGADFDELRQALSDLGAEIIDIREPVAYEPKIFGKMK